MKIIIVVGILFAVMITVIFLAMAFTPTSDKPKGLVVTSFGNRTPEQFFQNGGRSYILVTPDSQDINATIGSTIQVSLTLTHKTSSNPLSSLTVHYMGARCCANIRGYGDIYLNSTVKSSNSEITLPAGESKKVVLTISIPKDLPKSSVNATIPYNVLYALPDDADPKEAVTSMAFFQIHIVG